MVFKSKNDGQGGDKMEQQTEEKQDEIKQDRRKLSRRKKKAVLAVIAAALALLVLPVMAWLYMQRSMETITKINMPALFIGAGDAKPIQELELSNIDVSAEQKYKDIVFCVYSTKPGLEYDIQLAHTTNIGFTYEIYKASLVPSDGDVSYLNERYKKGNELNGSYLNKGDNGYATAEYHETTYAQYDKNNVQAAAEPLYWRTTDKEKLPAEGHNGNYINYYILHISWDEKVQDNKETDMVYLMAG